MDSVYDHKAVEEVLYEKWEQSGGFQPEIHRQGKPFCIILPPPNANGDLHFGHAMFTIEDILIRFHRMKGYSVLWLPGTDHAGIETQFVFEKKLQEEGKSRFDYSKEELYQLIWDFVRQSHGKIQNQLRRLGFSLDWTRERFTLDKAAISLVHQTFKRLYDENHVYRGLRLVSYCIKDGTSFSDLEVNHVEKEDTLYYIKYPLLGSSDVIVVATTRPETMLGDTAVAVHPDDDRYRKFIGKKIALPLTNREIPIIADSSVDVQFGSGVVKVTPAHDQADNDRARKHNLEAISVIDLDGKMSKKAGAYKGVWFKKAREEIVLALKKLDLIKKEERIRHQVPVCYKCKSVIQPLLMEQWFIRIEPFAKKAIAAILSKEIMFFPDRFETFCIQWLNGLHDWNISRQIVWGIRIPAWKCTGCYSWTVTAGDAPLACSKCNSTVLVQDEDTFDTWFSSSQWPVISLKINSEDDFKKFYPTSVMETGYDILKAWVSRMILMGIDSTDQAPFHTVVLHGLVNDPYGKKMSKSKGNVVNPLELVDQYGADAVRFALIYGTALGNDQALSYAKLEAARRFANKLWNIARFIELNAVVREKGESARLQVEKQTVKEDREWIRKVHNLTQDVTEDITRYNFNYAAEKLYEFIWHKFADEYIEDVKKRIDMQSSKTLCSLFLTLLKLLHPFMPFITEEIFQRLFASGDLLMLSSWPEV